VTLQGGGRPDLVLRCGDSRAIIRPHGAELRAWGVGGADLLWPSDPAVWPAVSPILFPIVGRLRGDRLRLGSLEAGLGVHGFAAHRLFTVETLEPDRARLISTDDEATRAVYPFAFALTVEYVLGEDSLSARIEIENRGAGDMPYACGLHPGFRWPFDGGDPDAHLVEFEKAEVPKVPDISPGGLFERGMRDIPLRERVLPIERALFAREALCFLNVASRAFRLISPSGRAIAVRTTDFPHIALWSRPPAPFLCLETWTGHGDPVDFAGDLFDKPSMRRLRPGRRAAHAALYHFS
jgi:galactose mutarotase-like enzyme